MVSKEETTNKVLSIEEQLKIVQVLKAFKELLDCGIITEEEFQHKKEELLNMAKTDSDSAPREQEEVQKPDDESKVLAIQEFVTNVESISAIKDAEEKALEEELKKEALEQIIDNQIDDVLEEETEEPLDSFDEQLKEMKVEPSEEAPEEQPSAEEDQIEEQIEEKKEEPSETRVVEAPVEFNMNRLLGIESETVQEPEIQEDIEEKPEIIEEPEEVIDYEALTDLGKELFNKGHKYKEAVEYFTKAAKGSPRAKYNLYLCYLYGYGVKKDSGHALTLLEEAAEEGFDRAIQELKKYNG